MSGALIVTAQLDAASQSRFDEERQRHFPAAINFLSAHVTLFHALPGDQQESVAQLMRMLCRKQGPCHFETRGLRFLGRGVAYDLHMPEVVALRASLAMVWMEWLTPQDRQTFRPHVTVQNKVAAVPARALLEELQAGYAKWQGLVTGFALWEYQGGPWRQLEELPFGDQRRYDLV